MRGYVGNIDWVNAEAQKYWSFPKSAKKDPKEEIRNFIFSGDYCGALKRDGYYERIVKDDDGEVFMVARNPGVNGVINKVEWVPHLKYYFDSIPNGTVLLCEIFVPGNEGSKNVTKYLGCTKEECNRRMMKDGKFLKLYVFDICAYAGVNLNEKPIEQRIVHLQNFAGSMEYNAHVEYATYYWGEELWEKLQAYLAAGNEGMVILRRDCPIYFKRTPAKFSIKIKKELQQTIDCFFTGHATIPTKEYSGKEIEKWRYWVNAVTDERLEEGLHYFEMTQGAPIEPVTKPYYYEWGGSLEIALVKRDKVVPIGWLSGVTDEIKANPMMYKGRCIEVSAMEIMEDSHALRHAKMIQFRDDLTIHDCTWEKVFSY